MTVPRTLRGAWRRESITVGDGEPSEPQQVRYLQAAGVYADVRVSKEDDEHLCFAGTSTWTDEWAKWGHDLGLAAWAGTDEGALEWIDGGVIETGSFDGPDGPIPYVEVWQRLPSESDAVLALRAVGGHALLVRVGDHSLVLADDRPAGGGFAARYDVLTGGAWTPEFSLGDAGPLPTVLDGHPAVGDELEIAGRRWLVEEAE